MTARLRALLAGGCLTLLLAGIPALLSATVGNPAGGLADLLAGDVSDAVVIDVLAAVAYLAWGQFALAVTVETISTLTRRPVARGIPGVFAAQQHLAHILVAALLLGPSLAAPAIHHPAPAAATASVLTLPATTTMASVAPTPKARDTITHVVRDDGPGTLWDLAETYLGNGQRWPEIWRLNRGRHQDDGTVMTSPGLLRPGWTVLIPAAAAEDPSSRADGEAIVVVRRGDTLSEIAADHHLPGWSGLWRLNRGRAEPGGKSFTDPDHIEPGWTIQLPHAQAPPNPRTGQPPAEPPRRADTATADANPTKPAAAHRPTPVPEQQQTASAPTAPSTSDAAGEAPADVPSDRAHETVGVDLGGGWIGLALAAALAAAGALVWRRRRRRYRYGRLDPAELDDVDLIPLPGTITAARRVLREQAPHLLDPPPAAQPTVAEYAADQYRQPLPPPGPDCLHLTGLAGLVDLVPGAGLGLTGPGAEAAARALLVACLAAGNDDDPEAKGCVVIPADTLTTLLGAHAVDIGPVPRLTVTSSLADALTTLEVTLIQRQRALDEHTASSDDHASAPFPPMMPPVLLLADTPPAQHQNRLATTIRLGEPVRISAVVLGEWPLGDTLTINADGCSPDAGPGARDLDDVAQNQRIAILDTPTTIELLDLLREAHTGQPPDRHNPAFLRTAPAAGQPQPEPAEPRVFRSAISDVAHTEPVVPGTEDADMTTTERNQVRIRLLGQPDILDREGQPVTGLRLHARELLVYLAVHRTGADLSDLMEALWPDAIVRRAQERLSTEVANLRRCIRTAAGDTSIQPVINTGGRYNLNTDLLDIDIWTLDDALRTAASTQDPDVRADSLRRGVEAHIGVLADGYDYDWIEPHREHHRRHGIRARIHLAEHLADTDPEGAAALTEAAADLDPGNEDLARRAMQASHNVGDPAAIKARLRILRRALEGIDEEPTPETIEFIGLLRDPA